MTRVEQEPAASEAHIPKQVECSTSENITRVNPAARHPLEDIIHYTKTIIVNMFENGIPVVQISGIEFDPLVRLVARRFEELYGDACAKKQPDPSWVFAKLSELIVYYMLKK